MRILVGRLKFRTPVLRSTPVKPLACALLLFVGITSSGCTVLAKMLSGRKRVPRAERVHPAPERVGVVILVNETDHFALVDTTNGVVPEPGTALKVLRNGTEVGVLHSGEVRKRPFVVGDVVNGALQKGDEVFR